jgi:uncharacterized protein YjbI with pentapeptide repeats
VPCLAVIVALIFTWLSIRSATDAANHQLNATSNQLQIAERGQITDRYNAAITNLGSLFVDVRLGGIYGLQQIMQDSPRDQPTIVAVLCAFVRDHAKAATVRSPSGSQAMSALKHPPTDIQAAVTVVGTRDTGHDGSTTVLDFSNADLSGADLTGAQLHGANLNGADLSNAQLYGANLSGATLYRADLSGAFLPTNLAEANLIYANLSRAYLTRADLTEAVLIGADLSRAELGGANLAGADLLRANLPNADLISANLSGATLAGANLSGADLTGAAFSGAKLTGTHGLNADAP